MRAQNFSRPRSLQLPARVQWRLVSMSRHNFTACNTGNLSRNLLVQLFISISCSIVSEKLANRGIVWLSNGKGWGLPGNTEAPLPMHLLSVKCIRRVCRDWMLIISWKGETSRNMLSVHFLSIVLDFAPSRLPRHVCYVHPAYLVSAVSNKCMLSVKCIFPCCHELQVHALNNQCLWYHTIQYSYHAYTVIMPHY